MENPLESLPEETSYEQAKSLLMRSEWKTEECGQEECWCLMIVPKEPINYTYNGHDEEMYVAGSGCIPAFAATLIVKEHNEAIKRKESNGEEICNG